MAEKLRKTNAKHSYVYDKTKYNVTVSLGLAETEPAVDAFTKNDLISFAYFYLNDFVLICSCKLLSYLASYP